MMDGKTMMAGTACGAMLAVCTMLSAAAQSQPQNALVTAQMPVCGTHNPSFETMLKELKQRTAWRGVHENEMGELELTVGRNGAWFLFYHAIDTGNRKLVCLVARGRLSRESFGSPV